LLLAMGRDLLGSGRVHELVLVFVLIRFGIFVV
jgi:hypothetical protein